MTETVLSFQYNMRVTEFEGCPSHRNAVSSAAAAAYTYFDSKKQATRKVEINVVNKYNVDVGCTLDAPHCLGVGALEIILDRVKITQREETRQEWTHHCFQRVLPVLSQVGRF